MKFESYKINFYFAKSTLLPPLKFFFFKCLDILAKVFQNKKAKYLITIFLAAEITSCPISSSDTQENLEPGLEKSMIEN